MSDTIKKPRVKKSVQWKASLFHLPSPLLLPEATLEQCFCIISIQAYLSVNTNIYVSPF